MENERVLPADDFLAAHTGLLPVQKRKIFPSPDALMSVVGRQKKKSQPPPGLLGLSLITKVKQNGKGSAVRSSRARWRDGGRISTKSKWEAIDSCCCVLCVKKSRFICIFHHRSRPTLASANLCAGRGRPMASISVWTHNPCIAPSEKKNV